MSKCIICNVKPASKGYLCYNCQQKIEAERRRRQNKAKPERYLLYRGNVVGLFSNGDNSLSPKLLNCNPKSLPKSKVLNLDTYLPGFTRDQIRRFKKAVKQVTAV